MFVKQFYKMPALFTFPKLTQNRMSMVQDFENTIKEAYQAFNARNIDKVLPLLHRNVRWPNGWEGGYVEGHAAVRDYWTRQWQALDPMVEPQNISETTDGRLKVQVHQLVKDLSGNVVADGMIYHIYTMEDGLIKHMLIDTF